MISQEKTKEALDRFADYVIQQSRSNLTKGKINASKDLYNSFKKNLVVSTNSIQMNIEAKGHWKFVDEGVRGAGGVRKTTSRFNSRNNKGKLWEIKAKQSQYKFTNKKPPINEIKKWGKLGGVSPYAVQTAVFHQGIKPTKFLTTPFERAFKALPDEVVEAYGLDLESFFEYTLNRN
jgi:hypothetical protein